MVAFLPLADNDVRRLEHAERAAQSGSVLAQALLERGVGMNARRHLHEDDVRDLAVLSTRSHLPDLKRLSQRAFVETDGRLDQGPITNVGRPPIDILLVDDLVQSLKAGEDACKSLQLDDSAEHRRLEHGEMLDGFEIIYAAAAASG